MLKGIINFFKGSDDELDAIDASQERSTGTARTPLTPVESAVPRNVPVFRGTAGTMQ